MDGGWKVDGWRLEGGWIEVSCEWLEVQIEREKNE